MKKTNATLILLLLTFVAFGQYKDYDRGFKNGFKEGYCYNDYGCISPIAPITPIPLVGESNDNYQDGYNRGFKWGLEDKQSKKSNSGGYKSGQGTSIPSNLQQYKSTYVSPDYSLLIRAMEMRQVQYERNLEIKKQKAISLMNQVKAYYNSLSTYPENISDGWHKVIAMDNYDFCDERKVYVVGNKIIKYVADNWIEKSISYSPVISKARSMLQLIKDDGTNGGMVELYFLEDINNPNSNVPAPLSSGKASFWTSWKRAGSVTISIVQLKVGSFDTIEELKIGQFDSYFNSTPKNCGQNGTINFEYKPGTYNYKAVGKTAFGSEISWEGQIVIKENSCSLYEIRRN